MKKISPSETQQALDAVDQFLWSAATTPEIENYDQFRSLVRPESYPLPDALSTLIKANGKYINYNPYNRVSEYTKKTGKQTLTAEVSYIGEKSSKELVTITNRIKGMPILGTRSKQYVCFDEGCDGSFDVSSSDVRSGEHFFFMPKGSDDAERLTRFVKIAAPLVEKLSSLVR